MGAGSRIDWDGRRRWKEEMEARDVRRQRQLEEESWRGKSTKQKKKKRERELKTGTQSVSRWRRKGWGSRGEVCVCVGWRVGGRDPGSSPASIFDAPAHFHYFWLDADEGSSRQSGTKVHLSCWPTLSATKRALWGGFSLMDGQQRLLGHRATPEPLDILAFSGRKKKRRNREKIYIRTVQICQILKLESPTDNFDVGISGNGSLQNHIPYFKTILVSKKHHNCFM